LKFVLRNDAKIFQDNFSEARGGGKMGFVILSIYPMATSTSFALFDDDTEIKRGELQFEPYGISETGETCDQFSAHEAYAEDAITEWLEETKSPDIIIGGAFLRSQFSKGIYVIDDDFIKRLCGDYAFTRIINRGSVLASRIARRFSARPIALVTVSNREIDAIYKISGIRGVTFNWLTRMMRIRDAICTIFGRTGASSEKCSVIAAYLGNGFSVCSQSKGRVRDFSDSFESGAFSMRHTGSIPATSIVRMAYSGKWSKADLLKNVYESGGLSSYLPGAGLDKVISMMMEGDAYASIVLRAMVGQLAAELSAHAAALYGQVDAFVLMGEYAMNEFFISLLKDKISWICDKIMIYEGRDELNILAHAAGEFLKGGDAPAIP
jgi:butyrate kinase